MLFEITLNNLSAEGDIDEQDFLDRADVLCSIGQTVLISNYQKYYKLVEFFSRHTKKRMGVIMGASTLVEIFNERYYRDLNGGILEAFGILFSRDLKILPTLARRTRTDVLWNSQTTPIIRASSRCTITCLQQAHHRHPARLLSLLSIFSRKALESIKNGGDGWVDMVPDLWTASSRRNACLGIVAPPTTQPLKIRLLPPRPSSKSDCVFAPSTL